MQVPSLLTIKELIRNKVSGRNTHPQLNLCASKPQESLEHSREYMGAKCPNWIRTVLSTYLATSVVRRCTQSLILGSWSHGRTVDPSAKRPPASIPTTHGRTPDCEYGQLLTADTRFLEAGGRTKSRQKAGSRSGQCWVILLIFFQRFYPGRLRINCRERLIVLSQADDLR